jgi:hypothetical protein
VAPEVFSNKEYDTKVDVFSFALILQEVSSFYISKLGYMCKGTFGTVEFLGKWFLKLFHFGGNSYSLRFFRRITIPYFRGIAIPLE